MGLDFLASLFELGSSYSVINSTRSMLSSTIMLKSKETFGKHSLIIRLCKGVWNQRPQLPRYSTTCDISAVIEILDS